MIIMVSIIRDKAEKSVTIICFNAFIRVIVLRGLNTLKALNAVTEN